MCWCAVKKLLTHSLPNPNPLAAISKGMQAVKFGSNNIFQLLTEGAG